MYPEVNITIGFAWLSETMYALQTAEQHCKRLFSIMESRHTLTVKSPPAQWVGSQRSINLIIIKGYSQRHERHKKHRHADKYFKRSFWELWLMETITQCAFKGPRISELLSEQAIQCDEQARSQGWEGKTTNFMLNFPKITAQNQH